jgi:hypothetical protein
MEKSMTVNAFAVMNFVFAGILIIIALIFGIVLIYGIFFSGDTEEEIESGVMGCVILTIPLLIGIGAYLSAGIGLLKRKKWGYYLHIAAAILSFFTLILIAYTIVALIFAFRPEFQNEFKMLG